MTAPLDHDAAMRLALDQAHLAYDLGEVPVGAVIVRDGRPIAAAYNLREALSDPCAHAECLALTRAGRALGTWCLDDCILYSTLEPCAMCAGAVVLSRIRLLVYGAPDPKFGACRSLYRLADDPRFPHRSAVLAGVLAPECSALLTNFFRARRPPPTATIPPSEGCLSG